MNRVLKSIASIALVAALGLVGSQAFFSDTETSTGNFFQAGAVDLKIDSECHYYELTGYEERDNIPVPVPVYREKPCLDAEGNEFGTWASTDLTEERFYAFHDVKPGDFGENTISVTVEDNDAWACMYIENAEDADNTQTEPEAEVDPDGLASGELAENLHFTAWLDWGVTDGWQGKFDEETNPDGDKGEGDNVWQGRGNEPLLFSNISGPASDVLDGQMYPLADSQTGPGPLEGGVTHYYGVAWCAGELTVGPGNLLTCDGEPMGNEAQTDSFSADVRFYVEQSRNNPDFVCPEPELPEAEVSTAQGWSAVDLDDAAGGPGKEWFAKARNNNNNFEVAVGTNDAGPEQDTAETTWTAGVSNPFTLEYDGAGNATLTTGGETVSYAVGTTGYERIGINVKAPNAVTTEIVSLNLSSVAPLAVDNLSVTGVGNTVENLLIESPTIDDAWTLTGEFTFGAVGAPHPQEYPAIQFSID